jgi:ankyrin repeat protein
MSQERLLKLYNDLGYSHPSWMSGEVGLCNGVTMSWLEACFLNQEEIFDARFTKINQYSNDLEKINSDVTDLRGFYDRLDLYMYPMKHPELFNAKYNQNDFELISKLAGSEQIQERGGIKKIYSESVVYNKEEIADYLDELARAFEKSAQYNGSSQESFGIMLHNLNHAIGLSYKPNVGWKLMDINQYPTKAYRSSRDVATQLIASFKSANPNSSSYLGLTSSVIVTGSNPNLSQFKNNLDTIKNGHQIEEIAGRMDTVNLAWLAARDGDANTIDKLNKIGANINSSDTSGNTPVHIAAQNGQVHAIETLWKAGASLNTKNKMGATPARFAVIHGQIDVLKLLKSTGINLDEADEEGITLLHVAAANGCVDVINFLVNEGCDLNKKAKDNLAPIDRAITQGTVNAVFALKNAGVDINDINACRPLLLAAQKGDADMVKTLLVAGGEPDLALPNGLTAMFYAAQFGHGKVIETLLQYGAKLDIPFTTTTESLRNFAKKNNVFVNAKINIIIDRHLKNGEKEESIAITPYEIAWIMGHKKILEAMSQRTNELGVSNDGILAPEWTPDVLNVTHFIELMAQVPANQRFEIIKVDEDGSTMLHGVAKYAPEAVTQLWELLPEEQRLEALKVLDKNNQSVLQVAQPESLKSLINSLPDEHKLEALEITNKEGVSFRQTARMEPESLLVIESIVSDLQQTTNTNTTTPTYSIPNNTTGETTPSITQFRTFKEDYLRAISPDDKTQQILQDISAMIARLQKTENVWYMHSATPKINALTELKNLIANENECWSTFNPKNYGDVIEHWKNTAASSNTYGAEFTNSQLIDFKRNILSSTATSEIDNLIEKYGDAPLREVDQENSSGLSK